MADARERLVRISEEIGDHATADRARNANGGNLVVSARAQKQIVDSARVEAKKWLDDIENRCRRVLLNALGSEPYDRELIALQLGNIIRSYVEKNPRGEQFAARGRRIKIRDQAKYDEWQRTKMPYQKALRTGRIVDDAIAGEKARAANKRLTPEARAQAAANAERLEASKAGAGKAPAIARKWEAVARTAWNRNRNTALVNYAQENPDVVYLEWFTARELHLGGGPVCEVCEQYELLTLPKDHPRWGTHRPPLHYNCRCELVEVTREQSRAFGIRPTRKADQPDWDGEAIPAEGFGG
jgi:hypothetical protein